MDIILLQNLDKVGEKYDVVTVKNGYGRNFLIPKGLALIANDTNMRRLEDLRRRQAAKESKMKGEYETMAASLEGKMLKIIAKAGTSGKIFGSVTSIQISQAIRDQFGLDISRKKIELKDEVKMLGEYKATLNLHPEVVKELDFSVITEEKKAAAEEK